MTVEKDAFIIGGAGFLGKHLVEDLYERGYTKITVFDLVDPSRVQNDHDNFLYIQGDISNVEQLTDAMKGHSLCFHVASPPYHLNDRELFHRVNVEGTLHVIDACEKAAIGRLVLTSSASVLFNGRDIKNAVEEQPFPEHYLDYYTQTKMFQEQLVMAANNPAKNLRTVAIRPHGIFGPGDHTISEIISKAREGKMKFQIGDGSNIVDFTYVRNVTHGHILAAEALLDAEKSKIVAGQAYHITNDEPIQFWVFMSAMLIKLGYRAPSVQLPYYLILALAWLMHLVYVAFGGVLKLKQPFLTPFKVSLAGTHHYYSCEKAKRDLAYKPVVSLRKAMNITAQHFSAKKEN